MSRQSAPGATSGITFHTDFDRGSLGQMSRVGPSLYRGTTRHWIKADGIGDQYYWFFFRAAGTKGETATFELGRLTGIYRGNTHEVYTSGTQPVYSYDQSVWHRIPDVSYDDSSKVFRFTHTFESDTVWIAYAHPYPWERAQALAATAKQSPFAHVDQLGRSRERRPIHLITITDPSVPAGRKQVVFVQALQHSGEDAGGYMAEGMVRFLLSDTEETRRVRERFVVHVVPALNPDGLVRGITRYNAAMADLNSLWTDSIVREPEVAAVKQWIAGQYQQGVCVAVFLDIHNQTQQWNNHALIVADDRFRRLLGGFASEWTFQKTTPGRGTAAEYMAQRYDVPAATVELTQSHTGDGRYLDIEDYMRLGERTLLALTAQLGGAAPLLPSPSRQCSRSAPHPST